MPVYTCLCVCESAVICHLGSPQEGENILLPLMIADSCQREEREDSRREKEGGRRITKGETAAEREGEEKAEEGGNEGRKVSNAEGDIRGLNIR